MITQSMIRKIINIVEHDYKIRSVNETKVSTNLPMTTKYDETGYEAHPLGECPLP